MFTKNNNIKVKCKIDEKVKFILVALAAILKSLLILIKKVSKLLKDLIYFFKKVCYCLKSQKNTESKNPKVSKQKNGRIMFLSKFLVFN